MARIFQISKKLHSLLLLGVLLTSPVMAYNSYPLFDSPYNCYQGNCCYEGNCCYQGSCFQGYNCYNPCFMPIEIGISLIYFQPSVEDSYFVLSSINNIFNREGEEPSQYPNGKRYQNCTSFSPGFRVAALFGICPNSSFWDLRFTYLTASSRKSVSGPLLYDTNGWPGFGSPDAPIYSGTARSKNSYKYYAGDLTYDRRLGCFYPDSFTFLVGLHTAYIKFRERSHNTGTFFETVDEIEVERAYSDNLNRFSQFYGIGPQFGLTYQYILPSLCCLSGKWALNAKLRASLLAGYNNTDFRYVTLRTGPTGVRAHNVDHCWRVVPAINSDLSISYNMKCSCFCTTLELGYEFNWYSRCIDQITGVDTAFAGVSFDNFKSFSLQGPYLSLNVCF